MDPVTTTTAAAQGIDPIVSTVFGYLNIFAGILFVVSLGMFITGWIYFIARLGLDGVSDGFDYMRYGVVTLFVLVVMLGIIHYIQYYTQTVLVILSVVVTIWLLMFLAAISPQSLFGGGGEKKE